MEIESKRAGTRLRKEGPWIENDVLVFGPVRSPWSCPVRSPWSSVYPLTLALTPILSLRLSCVARGVLVTLRTVLLPFLDTDTDCKTLSRFFS